MIGFTSLKRLLLATATLGFAAHAAAVEPALSLDVYNPGTAAIFPVTSVLVSGKKEAILVDAQFGKSQAEQLVEKIRASGKQLTTIYISHGDPDYYFGLDTITQAFPKAKVVASQPTVEHIKATVDGKLAFWGPKMGADVPAKTIVPGVLKGHSLTLEGQKLDIIGLDGKQPDRTFVWIPSIKAVVGGVVVAENIHVWMADTQSAQSHKDWLTTLDTIAALKPKTVVPGHYLGESARSLAPVHFTADYIKAFDEETAKAKDSAELIAAMKKRYPDLGEDSSLELSAKVAKGEMKW
ncbi:Metallo-beta-lactamase superfamily protein [Pseudomonas chlororaphis subsp. aurantiaca]|uniref:MBL fold metallo-hydrolase n=1 Tax=Pseudomonas chlororaphis subsp. aurantiaca TaxID=86192 RepID=A0AAJ1E3B2_9PSED|nr:MBL fold metallo-hydrolase [Pseudomonas chlororaphis]AZD37748.1 Metallo-beta-lactamase superfamily protein [Pseudomonas chlororaphis subsp. aurantiaca]AZD44087.1 Metallo-beta-lactamase superfamily protein [Pseudomonas chlororaphis subsp. aurantiaca]AZD50338.1 Metallo-beta-lactamase superfamily protein [Pseudomonas chlororaphis subsp. aurantiaca]AZD75205.1 Metallo-beta-lactamase superfamily protein [Pseudomonas chlororaphis subsp. aurantiaca]MBU4634118.1 MBL fold metallo-hydrolase [Pseudomon